MMMEKRGLNPQGLFHKRKIFVRLAASVPLQVRFRLDPNAF